MWICKMCGKEFAPKSNAQKYCSEACSKKAHNQAHKMWKLRNRYEYTHPQAKVAITYKRACEECGKHFETNRVNTVCCSDECKKKRMVRQIKANLEYHKRRDEGLC